jgi:hypothetical protein
MSSCDTTDCTTDEETIYSGSTPESNKNWLESTKETNNEDISTWGENISSTQDEIDAVNTLIDTTSEAITKTQDFLDIIEGDAISDEELEEAEEARSEAISVICELATTIEDSDSCEFSTFHDTTTGATTIASIKMTIAEHITDVTFNVVGTPDYPESGTLYADLEDVQSETSDLISEINSRQSECGSWSCYDTSYCTITTTGS